MLIMMLVTPELVGSAWEDSDLFAFDIVSAAWCALRLSFMNSAYRDDDAHICFINHLLSTV